MTCQPTSSISRLASACTYLCPLTLASRSVRGVEQADEDDSPRSHNSLEGLGSSSDALEIRDPELQGRRRGTRGSDPTTGQRERVRDGPCLQEHHASSLIVARIEWIRSRRGSKLVGPLPDLDNRDPLAGPWESAEDVRPQSSSRGPEMTPYNSTPVCLSPSARAKRAKPVRSSSERWIPKSSVSRAGELRPVPPDQGAIHWRSDLHAGGMPTTKIDGP